MGKRQRASSSTLFLMELIMAILFFSIAATICIFVFTKSHIMHTNSADLSYSVNLASNTAEILRSSESTSEIVKTLKDTFPGADIDNNLNDNIIISTNGYDMKLEFERDKGMLCSLITVTKNSEFVYDLYVEHINLQ